MQYPNLNKTQAKATWQLNIISRDEILNQQNQQQKTGDFIFYKM